MDDMGVLLYIVIMIIHSRQTNTKVEPHKRKKKKSIIHHPTTK